MPNRARPGTGVFRHCLRLVVSLALLALLHTALVGGLTPAGAVARGGCPEREPTAATAAEPRSAAVAAADDPGCATAHADSAGPRAGLGCHHDAGLTCPRNGSAARCPATGAGHSVPAPSGVPLTVHGPDRAGHATLASWSAAAARCPAPVAPVSRLRC